MNFIKVIEEVATKLDQTGIRYALIGGFAMALRGVQRATVDLDFILMIDDLNDADRIFQSAGYVRAFKNENVSHYIASEDELGRIDILHAFRGPSLSMLERADRIEIVKGRTLPVVQTEDIIGLKIQAAINDKKRAVRDWADIQIILETAAEQRQRVDWELIESYLELFDIKEKLNAVRGWYGATE